MTHKTNRRKFLSLVGGGVILAATGSVAALATRTPKAAMAPWDVSATHYSDPRKRALSAAILSPNPHNRQPWLVDLSQPETIRLFVDTDRMLPQTDPFHRQITIGLGCFLETMRMAAAQDGYRLETTLFPDGSDPELLDNRPVALAKMIQDDTLAPDPLFAQLLHRRSVKEPYDLSRPVSNDSLSALQQTAQHGTKFETTNDVSQTATLRQLTSDALLVELATPHTYKESVDLMRIGKAEIEANPDGIDFSGPFFEALHLSGMMTRASLLDTNSVTYKQGIDVVLANANSAMGFVWQVTQTNTREDQIAAGQDWMRLHLKATEQGLALQPMSQALQEFPEMNQLYTHIHKMLAPTGGTLQMLARLGYADPVPASPRWPLEAKLIES